MRSCLPREGSGKDLKNRTLLEIAIDELGAGDVLRLASSG
jgi:hypothetical protein